MEKAQVWWWEINQLLLYNVSLNVNCYRSSMHVMSIRQGLRCHRPVELLWTLLHLDLKRSKLCVHQIWNGQIRWESHSLHPTQILQIWFVFVFYSKFKGIVSDSHNIFIWYESEDINKKRLFPKFQLIKISHLHSMHDYTGEWWNSIKISQKTGWFDCFCLRPRCACSLFTLLDTPVDYMHWHCSIYCHVKLILVDENLCENCFYFTMKWLLLNSFGEMCFLEESYKNKWTKFKFWNFWECPLYEIWAYLFKVTTFKIPDSTFSSFDIQVYMTPMLLTSASVPYLCTHAY